MENQYSTRRDFLKQAGTGLLALAGVGCATATQIPEAREYTTNELIRQKIGNREIEAIELIETFGNGERDWKYMFHFNDNGRGLVLDPQDDLTKAIVEKYKSKLRD